MISKSQKIRLGVFFTILVFLTILIFVLIIAPKMFQDRDIYYIGFKDVSVAGLQEGSSVKYHGLTVGFVNKISIDPKDITRVIVELSLEPRLPIKNDTKAEMFYIGITGLKVIELRSGTNEAENLKPGSFIQAGRSIAESITGRADVITEKAEIILNNIAKLINEKNTERFLGMVENTSILMNEVSNLLQHNRDALNTTIANTEQISGDLAAMSGRMKKVVAEFETFAMSDSLKQALGDFAEIASALRQARLVQLIRDMNITLNRANGILKEIEINVAKGSSNLVYSVESMRESIDYLNQFSRMISEDPSVIIRGTKPKNAPDYKLGK
ncbi:MCE family protein [bacterium]|nr:MCE family protein [bacterium]